MSNFVIPDHEWGDKIFNYVNEFPITPLENVIIPIKKLSIMDPEEDEPEKTSTSSRCIVLDLDGTLADGIPLEMPEKLWNLPIPVARPGLREFLEFVFEEFECVIIWTAANQKWYDTVYNNVLRPNLPPGKDFHFIKTRDTTKPYVALKPLSEIYAQFPQYNSSNTLVVDDNPETFKDNVENAIHIPSFFYDLLSNAAEERERLAALDRGLYNTIDEIRRKLREMDANDIYG